MTHESGTYTAPPLDSTKLAVDRTRLAHERTLMAWVRTAISLITFGFSIYKFFQIESGLARPNRRLLSTTDFAILMIVIGLMSLALALLQHHRDLRVLRAEYPDIPPSLATILAALISLLGIFALIAVVFRQ